MERDGLEDIAVVGYRHYWRRRQVKVNGIVIHFLEFMTQKKLNYGCAKCEQFNANSTKLTSFFPLW